MVVAIFETITVINESIAVALPTAVATRGLATVRSWRRSGRRRCTGSTRSWPAWSQGRPQTSARNWSGPARILGWLLVAVLIGTVLIGYVALGAFLVRQIVYLSGLGAVLYLLLIAGGRGHRGRVPVRRRASAATFLVTAGLHRESLDQLVDPAVGRPAARPA